MDYTLNEIERRVLGCLMEKSATQTSTYPMTVNALVAAANQRTNRDPVMDLDEEAVWSALRSLQQRGLVRRILPPPGSRADKFKHEVDSVFHWQSRQRAVMTELMLRGPQTAGELRTRCERMADFPDLATVNDVLSTLAEWDPPLVAPLPRAPGQSAVRYTHLLYPPDEVPPHARPADAADAREPLPAARSSAPGATQADEITERAIAGQAGAAARADEAPPDGGRVESLGDAAPRKGGPRDEGLREELAGLSEEVADLHEQVAELRRRLDALEGR